MNVKALLKIDNYTVSNVRRYLRSKWRSWIWDRYSAEFGASDTEQFAQAIISMRHCYLSNGRCKDCHCDVLDMAISGKRCTKCEELNEPQPGQ